MTGSCAAACGSVKRSGAGLPKGVKDDGSLRRSISRRSSMDKSSASTKTSGDAGADDVRDDVSDGVVKEQHVCAGGVSDVAGG